MNDRNLGQQALQREGASPRSETPPEDDRRSVRSSNDRDQQLERDGSGLQRDRRYDGTSRAGRSRDIDPDSAHSDINRDDVSDEP